MKTVLALVIALAGATAAYIYWRAPEPNYSAPKLAEPATIPAALASLPAEGECVRRLEVSGMHCGACSAKVYRALAAVPGVRAAAVDLATRSASAIVPRSLDVAVLEQALTFDEFAARAEPQ